MELLAQTNKGKTIFFMPVYYNNMNLLHTS